DVVVIDNLVAAGDKTKWRASVCETLGLTDALFIGGAELDGNFKLAAENIPNSDVLPIQGINVDDIVRRGKLVLSK
ncbi:50S ribosomal protein L4, partial [Rhizobium johnstonii]|uniref:50S ribosomal protein L4 n=1 Tax=Rhizobium johnstonii TaxID=3019933 RepID=UPI003F966D4D